MAQINGGIIYVFMMGITDGRKDFDFNQVITCDECGRYGRYQVYMTYMVLSLFFIPCFKWNRHYYVQTTCCNTLYELDPEIGRRIARGEDVEILPQHLQRVNPQYGYGFENGSGNTIKDAAIVDIQLQRTLNSAQNAAGGCNVFHVLMIICFYESTAIRQRMEHRKSLTKSVFDDLVVKIIPLQQVSQNHLAELSLFHLPDNLLYFL